MAEPIAASAYKPKDNLFGTAAIACYLYSVLGLLMLHVLRPDFAPADHMISEYAIGPFGWVMRTVFVALSGGAMMLFIGLMKNGPTSFVSRVGIALMGIASIGLLISAIYSMDGPGVPPTRSGEIHDISFLVNVVSAAVASILLSVGFGSDTRWRTIQRTSIVLTAMLLLAFVLQFLTFHKGMPFGLANRFFIVVALSWSFAISNRLRLIARQ